MENGNVAGFFMLNRVGFLLYSDFLWYADVLAELCRKKRCFMFNRVSADRSSVVKLISNQLSLDFLKGVLPTRCGLTCSLCWGFLLMIFSSFLRRCIELILLSKRTPSILIVFLFEMEVSFILLSIWFWFFLLVHIINFDFWLEMLKPVCVDHIAMLLVVSWRKCCTVLMFGLLHRKFKSSAKRLVFTGNCMVLVMSLIARRNRVTDSDEPWGIPFCWV